MLAVVAIVSACGYLAVGALGRESADSPLIVLDQSIGGVAIGMSQADVEALYSTADDSLTITLRAGAGGREAQCGWPHHKTHACRNDSPPRETYRRGMPVAIAYALSSAPFLGLGFGLLRISRA